MILGKSKKLWSLIKELIVIKEIFLLIGGLARLADIPYTTITKIETGVIKQPSVQAVAKIAKALGVSLDELVKGHK